MLRICCDICKKDTTDTIEDLFEGQKIFILKDIDGGSMMKENTLCAECKKTFFYVMENPEILHAQVHKMKLRNRIRYLFKRGLEVE